MLNVIMLSVIMLNLVVPLYECIPLLGLYSQNFTIYITYKWVQQDKVLHYTRLESLASNKQSSLLGPSFNHEENEWCEYGP